MAATQPQVLHLQSAGLQLGNTLTLHGQHHGLRSEQWADVQRLMPPVRGY